MTNPMLPAVLLLAAACGPSIHPESAEGSTGAGSGFVDDSSSSSGAAGSSTDQASSSEDGSTGAPAGSSSSSGDTSDGSSSTDDSSGAPADSSSGGASCALAPFLTSTRCECDGVPADPGLCGCLAVADGCECDGVLLPQTHYLTCAWPCEVTDLGDCICGNFPAPMAWCDS